jgi:hypothetical protein
MYQEFSPGQKVRTIYGETRVVLLQRGCEVIVYRPVGQDGVTEVTSIHPSKLFIR